jgi:flagellar biosynthesis anti-sigma factor FlgM
MKIENSYNVNRVDGVAKKERVSNRNSMVKNNVIASVDNTTVSGGAQIMAKAMETLKDIPEVREEQIASIRAQILSGQYAIRFDELAKKLSSNFFWE